MTPDQNLPLKTTLLFIATLTIMAGTAVAPSLPAIEQAFATTPHADIMSRMVLTLPSIFVAMCAPVAGALADRFGRKKLLIGSMLLYSAAGMSGLFVNDLFGLLIGRAALGLAIGGIMTIGTTLVGDYFAGAERERYLGLQQAFTQFGGVVFVIAGGLLADLHWRAPFAVYVAAILILPLVFIFLREPERATSQGENAGAAASSVNWAMVALLGLAAFLVNALFYTIPSQLPFFLRALEVQSASSAGYAMGAFNLAAALTALSFGKLRSNFAISSILAMGLVLMATGFALLAPAGGIAAIFAALAVLGFGLGLAMPSILSLTLALAPLPLRGRIAGIATASMFLGHFISPLASQPWIGWFGFAATYRDIAIIFAAMATLAALAAWFQHRMANKDQLPERPITRRPTR